MSEQNGKVIGIGGVFLKSPDKKRLSTWYSDQLGIHQEEYGGHFKWRSFEDANREHLTAWTVFPAGSTYFDPSGAPFMINYIVDDLDALLTKLAANGVRVDPKRENFEYGRFAWVFDPDGNKIELWEPSKS